MRAVVYRETGSATDVLEVVDRPVPPVGPGEARVRLVRAGVNPTDWKFRANGMNGDWDEVVPGQDGAGVVEEVGEGVDGLAVGDRVWTILAQWQRPGGTAAEQTVQPASRLVRLPDPASYDLGASLEQLQWITNGDHSFKPTKSSGLSEADNWATAVAYGDQFIRQLMSP